MVIHETLSDEAGTKYRVVKTSWLKAVMAIAVIEFILIFAIIAGLIDNIRAVEDTLKYSTKMSQRNAAITELLMNRTVIQQQMFLTLCEMDNLRAEPCLIRDNWWADPAKYPLIADDPESISLFPPKK